MRRSVLLVSMALLVGASTAQGAALPIPGDWPYPVTGEPTRAAHAMVSTVSPLASRIGLDVLKRGGNAVDATVAVGFALAVTWPEAGNIGGGGVMLIRDAKGNLKGLDYRETAPAEAHRDMFQGPARPGERPSLHGHLAVGTPGTVRGLWVAHRQLGRLRWPELLQPAIALARDGFVVDPALAASLQDRAALLSRNPEASRIFQPKGKPLVAGERLVQTDLAQTLRQIAERGPEGFYKGPVAEAIAADMAQHGGIVSEKDLASYRAKWRSPLKARYRGHTVISMPPPSAGGVMLLGALQMIADDDPRKLGFHSVPMIHLLAEVERRVYVDRNTYLGDPDFITVPLDKLLAPSYARERRASIDPKRATPVYAMKPGLEGPQTTSYVVVDREGCAVSNTYSLNDSFGSGVVAPGTGVLLNGVMDNFTTQPGLPNFYGLVQGEANAIAPGKRMLTSKTPTIVLDPKDRLLLVLGTPGGASTPVTILQVLINVLDYGMTLKEAINAPRFRHQGLPDRIDFEPRGFLPGTLSALAAMGHHVHVEKEPMGDVKAIAVTPSGTREGYADPRRGGVALGY
ncbi:gamma-glutamyltransferase [bacterium]|nr:gamma-glutamyltransferase [bacterium]